MIHCIRNVNYQTMQATRTPLGLMAPHLIGVEVCLRAQTEKLHRTVMLCCFCVAMGSWETPLATGSISWLPHTRVRARAHRLTRGPLQRQRWQVCQSEYERVQLLANAVYPAGPLFLAACLLAQYTVCFFKRLSRKRTGT